MFVNNILNSCGYPEKTLEIIETAKKHFPGLKIMARSNSWQDSYDLLDAGISDIYRETLDSALRLGADVLCKLGFRRHHSYRAVKLFRKHDEQNLRELAEMRHDHKELISNAKQRISDLETIMLAQMENVGKDKDIGWDATTLIEEFGKKPFNNS